MSGLYSYEKMDNVIPRVESVDSLEKGKELELALHTHGLGHLSKQQMAFSTRYRHYQFNVELWLWFQRARVQCRNLSEVRKERSLEL